MNPSPELDALILSQSKVEELEIKIERLTGVGRKLTWDTCANCLGGKCVSITIPKLKELERKALEYDRITQDKDE